MIDSASSLLPGSAVTLGAAARQVAWLNDDTVAYSSGNGIVLQAVATGAQVRLRDHLAPAGTSGGPAVFAACPARQLLAYAQPGPDAAVHVVSVSDMTPLATIKDASKPSHAASEVFHLSLSTDGRRLMSVSGPPHFHLDMWDLPAATAGGEDPPTPHTPAPGGGSAADSPPAAATVAAAAPRARHAARAPLPGRLVGAGAALFPANARVAAVAGARAARVLALDDDTPGAGAVRCIDINVSCLDAAPNALPRAAWAAPATAAPLADCAALAAGLLGGGARGGGGGAVARICIGADESLMVLLGGEGGGGGAGSDGAAGGSGGAGSGEGGEDDADDATIVWLDARAPGDAARTRAARVRGLASARAADVSPSGASLAVLGGGGGGGVLAMLSATRPSTADGANADADLAVVVPTTLSRFHNAPIVASVDIPGGLVLTAGGDGSLQLWSFTPAEGGGDSGGGGVAARCVGAACLPLQATCLAACRRAGAPCADVVVGTACGAVLVVAVREDHSCNRHISNASSSSSSLQRTDGGGSLDGGGGADGAQRDAAGAAYVLRCDWEMVLFEGCAVSAVAVSGHGDCVAAACEGSGRLAFLKLPDRLMASPVPPDGPPPVRAPDDNPASPMLVDDDVELVPPPAEEPKKRNAFDLMKASNLKAASRPRAPASRGRPSGNPTATPAADGPTIDATPIATSVKKKPPSSEVQKSWIKTFPFIFIATAVNLATNGAVLVGCSVCREIYGANSNKSYAAGNASVYSRNDLTKHSKCDEHKDAVDAKVKKDGGSGGIVAAAHAGARAHVEVLKGLLPTLLMGALWICTELLPGLKFASLLVALTKAGNTSAPPPAKVKFFKGSFKMTTAYKFAANFADAAIESLKERFFDDDPSLDILACFTIFDPVQYIGMGHAELDDFGNDSFQQLKDHFWSGDGLPNSPFSARGESFMATLDTEFKHVKTVIKDRLALTPSATMLNLWRFIARSSDSLMVPNIILLMNVYYVMALHTAEVERGFSIHRILKNRLRSRLMILMVDSLLRIWHLAQSFTGPRESENNSLINEAAEKLSGASLQSQGVNPPSLLKRLVEEVSRVQVSFLDRDLDEAARLLEKEGLEDVDPAVAFDVEGNIVEEEDAGEPDELESDEDDFPLIDLKKR
ncbi:hypothetical protein FOA52_010828 [Chlamydomonas sp. UWO 241]|nr:hypothetical protein FOA52_010828 [Chlamydomonas sp. UWO 241]